MKNLAYKSFKVSENEEIAKGIYKLSVEGDFNAKPGQFYMLRAWENEPLLSRPISVHNVDENKIYFIYQVVGQGTELLSELHVGDDIKLTGPLGNGFDTESIKGRVAIVAGGIGIAPLHYVAKQLGENCNVKDIDLYAGFRSEIYAVEEMRNLVEEVHITTEDGSTGHMGYVTEVLEAEKYDVVLCCGPEIMMNKVVRMCMEKKVSVFVSMEKHMACGIGACLVCTCKTKDGNKRSCKDGPVFSGEQLVL